MKMTRLRLAGFKSFVEPTEMVIERGLTGVVGPNGCGKSNLLEALRWVMGETSHKSMRAASMDDVIFAGTNTRPARQSAEVTIFLDNSQRLAPPEFNASDTIEITRRIEREAGSHYRINAREARARDVRILFEDAATGARSPALVRQGQIGEIVNARPDQRRRILEDAAGVAGLHSRRHDAELRLKAAEANLARVADVLGGLNAQVEGLKRQARAARRYKDLSGEIRRSEALTAHLAHAEAHALVESEERDQAAVLMRLAVAVEAESRAVIEEVRLAEAVPPLRHAQAERDASLARLKAEAGEIERELVRVTSRRTELERRKSELARDLAREEALVTEATAATRRLEEEIGSIVASDAASGTADAAARDNLARLDAERDAAETTLTGINRQAAESRARIASLKNAHAESAAALERIVRLSAALGVERASVIAKAPAADTHQAAIDAGAALISQLAEIETTAHASEEQTRSAGQAAKSAAAAAAEARLNDKALASERATLERLIGTPAGTALPPLIDLIRVAPGYEAALGAALGDDLTAPLDETAPVHWRPVDRAEPDAAHGTADPALPEGAMALIAEVEAPPALHRRLRQIGVVTRALGPKLQAGLKPGQRLVSIEGDLWRWDGFVAGAQKSAATQRLALRNRLSEIVGRADAAAKTAADLAVTEGRALAAHAKAESDERAQRQSWRDMQGRLATSRDALTALERAARDVAARLKSIEDRQAQAGDDLARAKSSHDALTQKCHAPDATAAIEVELARHAAMTADLRANAAEARAHLASLERDSRSREARRAIANEEMRRWQARSTGAGAQVATLSGRLTETSSEATGMAARPAELEANRKALLSALSLAQACAHEVADALAQAEWAAKGARETLCTAAAAVTTEKEAKARTEARLEAARTRRQDEARAIREAFEVAPAECLALAGLGEGAAIPTLDEAQRQLARLRTDRERLGGVNLAAEAELTALAAQSAALDTERADVEAAVAKLRGAIGQLNREAKKRLDEAFQTVDQHFRRLFAVLFNGGEARLEMIESEDPLEGGLEIIAKPPGKKPATLSLLSGGEQTLTALSLIFAVFLTNPSPICVLDEVDAPLDDSNVDRFATMMETMAAETETRFLVITHHPMTMARMNRLFGVTMGEKGVSQLVSVDLETARGFQEASAA